MDRKSFISFLYKVGNTSIETNNISISATNNALLLITAAGQITGTLMPTDNNPRTKPDAIDTLFGEVVKVCSNDADDDVLLLKDAILKTSSGSITYRYLYVFTDDIIAATIANCDLS